MSTNSWRVLRHNQPQFAKHIAALNRHAQHDAGRAEAVAEIIATVREEGDDALVKYAKKFDHADLSHGRLLLPSRMPQPSQEVR